MFNASQKKILFITIALLFIGFIFVMEHIYKKNINTVKTLSSIIHQLAENACGIPDTYVVDESGMKGSAIIYKREKISQCAEGEGNQYYVRCYDFDTEVNVRWVLPTKDIKVKGAYICLPEADIELDMFNARIQTTTLGKKSYFKDE